LLGNSPCVKPCGLTIRSKAKVRICDSIIAFQALCTVLQIVSKAVADDKVVDIFAPRRVQ
jgi:hypothetical protein